MSKPRLAILVYASMPYMRSGGDGSDFTAQNEVLFSAVSGTYLPLLRMFSRLESDGVPFRLSFVMPPAVCTLLSDPHVQAQYCDFLDRRIALGESELRRLRRGSQHLVAAAKECLSAARQDKADFTELYSRNLVAAFRAWAKKGCVEMVATTATNAYLPHYTDFPEVLNAQVETGLYAQRHFFGESGDGFFVPYMAYDPAVEQTLLAYGVGYSVVDARAILFSKDECPGGVFLPVRTRAKLTAVACDYSTLMEVSDDEAFGANGVYRAQMRDIGFESNSQALAAFFGDTGRRVQTFYKYYANGDGDDDVPYDAALAHERAVEDARVFLQLKAGMLTAAQQELLGQPGSTATASLVCAIPAEVLGQKWYEGVDWLEQLFRMQWQDGIVEPALCRDVAAMEPARGDVAPYPCSCAGSGYGENFLDSSNCSLLRHVYKASERMIDLTERFPAESGLKARLLNIASRAVLLAQSSDWQRMISEGTVPDYALEAFTHHISAFGTVYESLASNTVSTEWLTRMERETPIFPWINYRVFSRKK